MSSANIEAKINKINEIHTEFMQEINKLQQAQSKIAETLIFELSSIKLAELKGELNNHK